MAVVETGVVRTPSPLYGHEPDDSSAGHETGEHCCSADVWSTARSGMPVGLPVLSLHCSAGPISVRNTAVVPTIASESPHADVIAFFASSPDSFESRAFTTIWRQASPPLALMYSAHALTASTEPWNKPGRSDEPVSAITLTVIVVGLTPTSVAIAVVVEQTSEVVFVAGAELVERLSSPTFLPLLHAERASTLTSRTPTPLKRLMSSPRSANPWSPRRRRCASAPG